MQVPIVAPSGFRNLTPYLLAPNVDKLLAFYTAAFGAETTDRVATPNGVHSTFKLGDSMLMMGGPVEGRKATLHLYVDDLEATVQRALDAGAVSTYAITQAEYGERFAVVEDPGGNAWIIADRATSTLRHPDMGTVTPYLNPKGAAALIEFLKTGLGAEQIERYDHEPRGVAHCKMRLGQSILELGDPDDGASAFAVMFYLYVASADATYEHALKAGAVSIHPPAKQHYGEYVAAFTDPAGNQWYVAEHRPEA
jgi:PhnB protein